MTMLQMRLAALAALLLGLMLAVPASAATTGTVCGELTAFTAPTATADGSLTMNGTTEVVDSSAASAIDASTLATLAALAAADATTCLAITADADGAIVDVAVATTARICGDVAVDATSGATTVDGVLVPASELSADAKLAAVLDLAAAAGADACADLTVDATTGLVTGVAVDASIELCGRATADADGIAIGRTDVPDELLDAEGRAVLELAADANADLCAAVLAASVNGDTTVTVTIEATICAVVTGVSGSTVTLGDVTFVHDGSLSGVVEVGDPACLAISDTPGGPATAAAPAEGVSPELGENPSGLIPDTAARPELPVTLLGLLALVAGAGAALRHPTDATR